MDWDWKYDELAAKVAKEILCELPKPIAFCELEVLVVNRLVLPFSTYSVRSVLDNLCRNGEIKVTGTSRFGDAMVEIPLLDKLANL